ncbi:Maf family protein [Dongia soli]|uniref:Nucleoside triphosphate pyrophosphatase n=1 Tax=Dongia soli TaxID=600628 RepID=A0ABU5E6P8_9PROT|nr:Maf family nucleotide pyrophosphatase [Dongia soli]MDY0881983.1 Maf family nucleotide pyrophosphatase [Dongia soli]
MSLVLASGSAVRARMLEQAGVAIEVSVAAIDESTIKDSLRAEGIAVERVAEALAETKARRVASRFPGRFVLGADQMLEIEGSWLDKPADIVEARRHLQQLRGRSHRLISSVVLIKDETRIWHHSADAHLRMRNFSDAFLEAYLRENSPQILTSVGAYQLEGLGAQLFDRIDGDFFTILGLPLLPVLAQLRQHSLIAT